MPTVKLVVTLETDSHGGVSVRSFGVEPVEGQASGVAVTATPAPTPVVTGDPVPTFLAKLYTENEKKVLRMLIASRKNDTPVYRKEILKELGMDELLQWNGVSAWLTRKWRAATGNPNAEFTAIKVDNAKNDYIISFAPGISDEMVEELDAGLNP